MLTIDRTKGELNNYLNNFIWSFKIGDNIIYNLDIIYSLIEHHNSNSCNYKKPISVLCVSVIEALLVDFIERLDSATNHFPSKLESEKIAIKTRLEKEKKQFQSIFLNKAYQYRKLRNFGYKDLIGFCEEFLLLGSDTKIYRSLQSAGRYRNRVHIRNYFGSFERNESTAFSESRTQKIIDHMTKMFEYLSKHYSRP